MANAVRRCILCRRTNIGILTIGHLNPPSRSGSTSRMLRGLLDEIQIFGAVLSLDQIVRVQRAGSPAAPPLGPLARGFPEANTTYPDTDGIDTDGDGIATNDNVVIHLAAGDGFVKMADGADVYTFGFSDVTGLGPEEIFGTATLAAEFPAPTIVVRQGQKLFLKLSNVGTMMRPDLEDPHSVHYHGFPNAGPVFDGVPENSAVMRMGQTLHLFLQQDTYPMLNGRGYPDTVNTDAITNLNGRASQKLPALITATRGQKILLRISSLATVEFQTLTIQGIPMKVIGKGGALLRGPDPDGAGSAVGRNLYYDTSSITLGGGETADVILDTSRVAAGTYFMYAARLHQLSNDQEDSGGMMTEIVIR